MIASSWNKSCGDARRSAMDLSRHQHLLLAVTIICYFQHLVAFTDVIIVFSFLVYCNALSSQVGDANVCILQLVGVLEYVEFISLLQVIN